MGPVTHEELLRAIRQTGVPSGRNHRYRCLALVRDIDVTVVVDRDIGRPPLVAGAAAEGAVAREQIAASGEHLCGACRQRNASAVLHPDWQRRRCSMRCATR